MGGRKRPASEAKDLATDTTVRQCAATRLERPTDELIRFVAGPDGMIVPDLARRLPGRGVWVTADCAAVAAAVKAKAFSRSLKAGVQTPPELPGLVDQLLLRRTVAALSLANKAGQVATGFDKLNKLIENGELCALLHGSEAAEGGRLKLDRKFAHIAKAAGRSPAIIDTLTIEQMSLAIGRSNVVHAGLMQGGAASRLLSEAGRLARYRSGLDEYSAGPEQDQLRHQPTAPVQ